MPGTKTTNIFKYGLKKTIERQTLKTYGISSNNEVLILYVKLLYAMILYVKNLSDFIISFASVMNVRLFISEMLKHLDHNPK